MRISTAVAAAACLSMGWCHIQVKKPLPFRSPFDTECWKWPHVPDYNYKSPLEADGSDFPCKGHHRERNCGPNAIYDIGKEYSLEFDGTATHHGGSCQISLSYDNARTFRVIKSFEGGCPLSPGLNYTIPTSAAAGNAVLSWTWFNRAGLSQMYQNCIPVKINGKKTTHPEKSLEHLPLMYECNIGNGCTTVLDQRVCFPQPGDVVVQGIDENLDGSPVGPQEICPHRRQGSGKTPQGSEIGNIEAEDDEKLKIQSADDWISGRQVIGDL